MDRRSFIRLGAATLALGLPMPRRGRAADPGWRADRTLVLVELAGANDGLNAVVPFKDPAYYRLRPTIAIPRNQTEQLNGALGLHPSLTPLTTPWEARDMAIVLGVGYAPPTRSHARAREIWDTASDPGRALTEGWVGRTLGTRPRPDDLIADAIVLGGSDRAVTGKSMRSLYLRDPGRFTSRSSRITPADVAADNPALKHIAKIQHEVERAAQRLAVIQSRAPHLGARFPHSDFGRQMEAAARLIAAGAKVPLIKASLGGFDTHSNQRRRHPPLLDELAGGLVALRAALVNTGSWDRVLVMTVSEFGRSARENRNGGTGHGTAAAHIVLGGGVKGGVYGRQPSLTDLVDGEPRHTVDFRRLYATAAERWWTLPDARKALGGHRPMDFLKG